MTDFTATIRTNAAQALVNLADVKGFAGTLVGDPNTTSAQWGEFAARVAFAEGKAEVWLRLQQLIDHKADATEADVARQVVSMLTSSPSDSYSGRGNDLVRSRFDGMKSAAQDTQWL